MKKFFSLILVAVVMAGCGSGQVSVVDSDEVVEEVETVTQVPILMYHYVRDVNYSADPLGWNLSTAPVTFEKQLQNLRELGYVSVQLRDLAQGRVPKNAIILSFDDGTKDFYTTALPLLEKYGFTASIAVITGKIGHNGYMDIEQIRDSLARGVEVLGHSVDHRNMATMDYDTLRWEVGESTAFIAENFGFSPIGFVYPSGAYDERSFQVLPQYGYRFALTTSYGMADLATDNHFALPRIRVDNRDGVQLMLRKLENLKAEAEAEAAEVVN